MKRTLDEVRQELAAMNGVQAAPAIGGDPGTVWVLTVDHRHGQDMWVHETEAGAKGSLAGYVREWWSELTGRWDAREDLPAEAPDDDDEAIATYFENVDDEWSTLNQAAVLP